MDPHTIHLASSYSRVVYSVVRLCTERINSMLYVINNDTCVHSRR